jgi:hypothetical protein
LAAEAETAHSRGLRSEGLTAQHLAAEAECIAHSRHLHREVQTAQRSAAEAENTHSRRLRREDQTVQRSAAVTKKSSQVPPASSAPPIASRVTSTRSQGNARTEALMGSTATGDPFTYTEAMESLQRSHCKRAMVEESTSMLLNNLYLSSSGILIHLSVNNIFMSYPEAATKATIEVNVKLLEKYKITNFGPAC